MSKTPDYWTGAIEILSSTLSYLLSASGEEAENVAENLYDISCDQNPKKAS